MPPYGTVLDPLEGGEEHEEEGEGGKCGYLWESDAKRSERMSWTLKQRQG